MTTGGFGFEHGDDFVDARLSVDIPADRDALEDIGLTVSQSGSATGQYSDAASCRCSACHRTFENVEQFDRHRFRGRCRTPNTDGPDTEQGSRDIAEGMRPPDSAVAGPGDRAQHAEAAMPT
jgi:hypothetical protein